MLLTSAIALVSAGCTTTAHLSVASQAAARTPRGATNTAVAPSTGTSSSPLVKDPSGFAPGACVRLRPDTSSSAGSGDSSRRVVFIDAGHGGPDPGASGHTTSGEPIEEKAVTLAVALQATGQLRAAGFTVVLSRTADTTVTPLHPADLSQGVLTSDAEHTDLLARVRCANQSHAAVLVSVHFNAAPSASGAGALTVYDATRSFAAENTRLASTLHQSVLGALNAQGWQIPDGGTRTDVGVGSSSSRAGLAYGHLVVIGPPKPGYVDAPSAMPGAVVEPLFLTDPFEADIAASQAGQRVLATGIATGIERYLAAH